MKKRILAILFGVLIAMSFTACSGDGNYSAVKVEGKQDTGYTVYSNGGSAVQYGNYVYFINGNRGYGDADGNANVWGNVVKGALYRAELVGDKNGAEFDVKTDEATGLEFKSHKGLNYDEEIIDVVDVQMIAPKTIGTSGYAGGIYIYDDYVYYASPNNQKNKEGVVQSSKTDFFRTKLDGSKTQKIFTTSSDSADKPYGFYMYNGRVYLVVLDGTTLKSVRVDDRKQQVTQIATDVTSVVIPERPVYYKGIEDKGVENLVFFAREARTDGTDVQKTGTILEFVRPDGNDRYVFHADGKTASLDAVRDGLVFYRTVDNQLNTAIKYTNLYSAFAENGMESTYDAELSGTVLSLTTSVLTGYTYVYPFRPNDLSNETYCLYTTSSGIFLHSAQGDVQIYSGTANVKLVFGNDVFFTDSDDTNIIYSTNLYTAAGDKDVARVTLTGNTKIAGPGLDVVAGYLVYLAAPDDYASDYAFFYRLSGAEGREAQFIGARSSADVKPDATTDTGTAA